MLSSFSYEQLKSASKMLKFASKTLQSRRAAHRFLSTFNNLELYQDAFKIYLQQLI